MENQASHKNYNLQFLTKEIYSAEPTKIIRKKEGYKTMVLNHSITEQYIPLNFNLEQNNPNPFKELTIIKYSLPYQSKVTVVITNSYGKVMDKLISSTQEAGTYELKFSADGLPRGTYFCHIVADKFSDSREMELTK